MERDHFCFGFLFFPFSLSRVSGDALPSARHPQPISLPRRSVSARLLASVLLYGSGCLCHVPQLAGRLISKETDPSFSLGLSAQPGTATASPAVPRSAD